MTFETLKKGETPPKSKSKNQNQSNGADGTIGSTLNGWSNALVGFLVGLIVGTTLALKMQSDFVLPTSAHSSSPVEFNQPASPVTLIPQQTPQLVPIAPVQTGDHFSEVDLNLLSKVGELLSLEKLELENNNLSLLAAQSRSSDDLVELFATGMEKNRRRIQNLKSKLTAIMVDIYEEYQRDQATVIAVLNGAIDSADRERSVKKARMFRNTKRVLLSVPVSGDVTLYFEAALDTFQ